MKLNPVVYIHSYSIFLTKTLNRYQLFNNDSSPNFAILKVSIYYHLTSCFVIILMTQINNFSKTLSQTLYRFFIDKLQEWIS
jgi:hypothetical protein